ncbi:MAG: 2-amino-4-hydroxy-6-hydroxymethyldihydropteridine diphosphokinase [Chloroflexi bacterium RBG_16_68_14]|nr:MAG: 2-amino-4-hydroxy-6-hydroxymethyldihydropteridine diphosphokinase [Chloroflexi bacterium RBG_16_68_14]
MIHELPVVYLGLGSNLGDRRRNLAVALRRLEPLVRIEAVSSLYETDPVGPQDQPPYLNAVCRGVTGLPPRGLLRHLQEVERDLGRRLGPRWDPRPLDIDLLLYGDAVIDEPGLRVPHPELPHRAFVLVPLAELAAKLKHPELGATIGSLAKRADRSGVRKQADPGWEQG